MNKTRSTVYQYHMKLFKTLLGALFVLIALGLAMTKASALSGGFASRGSPQNNAVVQYTNNYYGIECTGILISPRVILTAGHCVMGIKAPSHVMTADGRVAEHPVTLFDGKWHPLPDEETFTVRIGPDRTNTDPRSADRIRVFTAHEFSSPPMTAILGHDDIAMIRLDNPVPRTIAIPMAVETNRPIYGVSELFQMIGYGPDCQNGNRIVPRSFALATGYTSTGPNYARLRLLGGAVGCGGDSGSPVLRSRSLIGIVQQAGSGLGIVKTAGRGDGINKPDLAAWIRGAFWCTHAGATRYTGDFDGDGVQDSLCHTAGSGITDIDYAANGLRGANDWQSSTAWCNHVGAQLHIGDINGDGRDDRICHTTTNGILTVNYANSAGAFANNLWQSSTGWCYHTGAELHIGDINGDGRDDRICHTTTNGIVTVSYATNTGTFANHTWQSDVGLCRHTGAVLTVQDYDNDRDADLICTTPHTRSVRVSLTNRGVPSMRDDVANDPPDRTPVREL